MTSVCAKCNCELEGDDTLADPTIARIHMCFDCGLALLQGILATCEEEGE